MVIFIKEELENLDPIASVEIAEQTTQSCTSSSTDDKESIIVNRKPTATSEDQKITAEYETDCTCESNKGDKEPIVTSTPKIEEESTITLKQLFSEDTTKKEDII